MKLLGSPLEMVRRPLSVIRPVTFDVLPTETVDATKPLPIANTIDAPGPVIMQPGPDVMQGIIFTFETQPAGPRGPSKPMNTCSHEQCSRAASGPNNGLCPGHGSRRKCQHLGESGCPCETPAKEGGLCKAHGGGIRCGIITCTKSSQEGGLCIAHGGGRGCKNESCRKLAKHGGFCISHGGGTRCKQQGCAKSAQAQGLCKGHGGGTRCHVGDCIKFAQSHGLCSAHGGGKRCSERGCRRLAKQPGGGLCPLHDSGGTNGSGKVQKIAGVQKSTAMRSLEAHHNGTTSVIKPPAQGGQNVQPALKLKAPPGGLMGDLPASMPAPKQQCCKANCTALGGVCRILLHALGSSDEESSCLKKYLKA